MRLCPPAHASVTSPWVRVAGPARGREALFSSALMRCTDGPTFRNEHRRPSTHAAASANALCPCARSPIKLGGSARCERRGAAGRGAGSACLRPCQACAAAAGPSRFPSAFSAREDRPSLRPAPQRPALDRSGVWFHKCGCGGKDPIWAPSVYLPGASPWGGGGQDNRPLAGLASLGNAHSGIKASCETAFPERPQPRPSSEGSEVCLECRDPHESCRTDDSAGSWH